MKIGEKVFVRGTISEIRSNGIDIIQSSSGDYFGVDHRDVSPRSSYEQLKDMSYSIVGKTCDIETRYKGEFRTYKIVGIDFNDAWYDSPIPYVSDMVFGAPQHDHSESLLVVVDNTGDNSHSYPFCVQIKSCKNIRKGI